jgi:hypothetical protein
MALARDEYDRATIGLSLGFGDSPSEHAPIVQLEVDRQGEIVGRVALPMEALGFSPDFDPSRCVYEEPPFAIAEQLWPTIREHVELARAGGGPVWLALSPPTGNLAVLPWERMLAPVLGEIPIVRNPSFLLFSPLEGERVDIVLCLSEPVAKSPFDGPGFLRRAIAKLLAYASVEIFVHVFTDTNTYEQLCRDEHGPRVVLHDPRNAPSAHPAGGGDKPTDQRDGVTNPWLLWIIDEMRESTAEIVHFVAHGYLASGGQSALALAESPIRNDDKVISGFVGPHQLAACLAQLGAWGVGFTSPPGNYSKVGLRELFYDIERLRIGPVVHHDAEDDVDGEQLAHAYARLIAGDPPAFSSAISIYVHPALFTPTCQPEMVDPVATVLADMSQTGDRRAADTPAWATSTKRYLGQAAARRLPDPDRNAGSAVEQASVQGIEDVLRWVNEVVQEVENGGER